MCRTDLQAPDLHWTIVIFGSLDSCYLQFLKPSWSGLLIARTGIRKDHFQLTCLDPMVWLFVSIKRVTGVVDVCALPLPVAPHGNGQFHWIRIGGL